jgi:hypothetical protein
VGQLFRDEPKPVEDRMNIERARAARERQAENAAAGEREGSRADPR